MHEDTTDGRILARNATVADSLLDYVIGITPRWRLNEETAMVFEYAGVSTRRLHTYWLPFPLRILWATDGVVTKNTVLPAFSQDAGRGDLVVECHPDRGTDVTPGDRVRVSDGRVVADA